MYRGTSTRSASSPTAAYYAYEYSCGYYPLEYPRILVRSMHPPVDFGLIWARAAGARQVRARMVVAEMTPGPGPLALLLCGAVAVAVAGGPAPT
eukprot:COSAG01_NODE_51350_length_355_cov_1.191406_1_plen_93_part_01